MACLGHSLLNDVDRSGNKMPQEQQLYQGRVVHVLMPVLHLHFNGENISSESRCFN